MTLQDSPRFLSGEYDYEVVGGDTIYYHNYPDVSATNNLGSVTSGNFLARAVPSWVVSTGTSYIAQRGRAGTTDPSLVEPADGAGSFYNAATRTFEMVTPTEAEGEPYDVRDYGATGDGVTDDAAAIQTAIGAAEAVGGGRVFMPTGTYYLSEALTIPNFVSLIGVGQSSAVVVDGDYYAISLDPGNFSRIENITIGASVTQTAGGGIDFTDAGSNTRVTGIHFGDGLFVSLNIAPAVASSNHFFDGLSWSGSENCGTGIVIGGGGALITNVTIRNAAGTAATDADIGTWVSIPATADTIKVVDSLFTKGAVGILVGGTSEVANIAASNVKVDQMTSVGISVVTVVECKFIGCEVSTCGVPGLDVRDGAKGFRYIGGLIQNCDGYGVIIRAGARDTQIIGSTITDNNTSDTASNHGIACAADSTYFQLIGNTIGNNVLLATGHQKYGIGVSAGDSDHYTITDNHLHGNDTAPLNDGGTGTDKCVRDNLPRTTSTIASATTIAVPPLSGSYAVVSGVATITSITESWVGRTVTLCASGAWTLTDGSNLNLAGNFTPAAGDTITLVSDGTNWIEIARADTT